MKSILSHVVLPFASQLFPARFSLHCHTSMMIPITLVREAGAIVLVGVLWGCTNPFLNQKTGASDSGKKTGSRLYHLFGIFLNWKFILPYLVNQLGSAAYVYTLSKSDISMSLPICNALAVIFTVITSRLIGEHPLSNEGLLGVLLAMLGITICFYAKLQ